MAEQQEQKKEARPPREGGRGAVRADRRVKAGVGRVVLPGKAAEAEIAAASVVVIAAANVAASTAGAPKDRPKSSSKS